MVNNSSTLYPSSMFSTGDSQKSFKGPEDIPHETHKSEDRDGLDLLDLSRSSSCPPAGTSGLHTPQANLESCNGYGAPLKTRDDMARSPSQATLYQSTSPPITNLNWEFTDQYFLTELIKENYFKAIADQDFHTEEEERKATSDEDMPKEGVLEARICEPGTINNIHRDVIPAGPLANDPPEWYVAPMQPLTLTEWITGGESKTAGTFVSVSSAFLIFKKFKS